MTHTESGTIVSISETKAFGANGFKKREVVIDTAKGQYPSPIPFTLTQDKCSMADNLNVGDRVTVGFWVNGRKWDGPNGTRYFIDLTCNRIEVEGKGPAQALTQHEESVKPDEELPF